MLIIPIAQNFAAICCRAITAKAGQSLRRAQKKPQLRRIGELGLQTVIPKRFERLTHALEGRCSIQLSYGTIL